MYRAICITAAHQKKSSLEQFMTVFDQLIFYPFHWKMSFNAYFNYERYLKNKVENIANWDDEGN